MSLLHQFVVILDVGLAGFALGLFECRYCLIERLDLLIVVIVQVGESPNLLFVVLDLLASGLQLNIEKPDVFLVFKQYLLGIHLQITEIVARFLVLIALRFAAYLQQV